VNHRYIRVERQDRECFQGAIDEALSARALGGSLRSVQSDHDFRESHRGNGKVVVESLSKVGS
jgi:hypothetical protein